MAAKKKAAPADDTLVANTNIAIEGKHFDAGAPIEDVSEEELRRAVSAKRVVTFAEYAGKSEPEADPDDADPSTGEQPEA